MRHMKQRRVCRTDVFLGAAQHDAVQQLLEGGPVSRGLDNGVPLPGVVEGLAGQELKQALHISQKLLSACGSLSQAQQRPMLAAV